MNGRGPKAGGINVIKIGGGLSLIDGALDRACAVVSRAAEGHRILVVPGGGPFADSVRKFARLVGLSPDAAHWMAILAMDQFAHVLAERISGAGLVDEPGAIQGAVSQNMVGVLAPFRWMRSADVLPHGWEVTSDSVAAFVAGAVEAASLILIKPASDLPNPVDPYFLTALPSGLSYHVIGCDRLEEIFRRLTG